MPLKQIFNEIKAFKESYIVIALLGLLLLVILAIIFSSIGNT